MIFRIFFIPIITFAFSSSCFGQDSFGPDTRWVYDFDSGFFYGIIIIESNKTETIADLDFDRFDKIQIRTGFNTDTSEVQLAPIYLRNKDDLIFVSFDGVVMDTLFDFNATEGDIWTLSHPNTDVTIELEVMDTFRRIVNDLEVNGQLLSYRYSTGLSYVDTVLNYVGNTFGYIDPFEFVLSGPETAEGGLLRCHHHPSLGLNEFNENEIFSYSYDCDNIVTSAHLEPNFIFNRVKASTFTSNSKLNITCEDCRRRRYLIFDIAGHLIKRGSLTEGANEIRFDGVHSGFYFLKIEGAGVHKFIHHSY